jgi:hypothetical protein
VNIGNVADMPEFKDFIELHGTWTGAWRGEAEDTGPAGTGSRSALASIRQPDGC